MDERVRAIGDHSEYSSLRVHDDPDRVFVIGPVVGPPILNTVDGRGFSAYLQTITAAVKGVKGQRCSVGPAKVVVMWAWTCGALNTI